MLPCNTGSCKLSDSIYAITSGSKIHRLTFSKSLADMLAEKTGYQAEKREFIIGAKLEPG